MLSKSNVIKCYKCFVQQAAPSSSQLWAGPLVHGWEQSSPLSTCCTSCPQGNYFVTRGGRGSNKFGKVCTDLWLVTALLELLKLKSYFSSFIFCLVSNVGKLKCQFCNELFEFYVEPRKKILLKWFYCLNPFQNSRLEQVYHAWGAQQVSQQRKSGKSHFFIYFTNPSQIQKYLWSH